MGGGVEAGEVIGRPVVVARVDVAAVGADLHHPAVAGNELAGILGTEMAFDPGFQQVATLRGDRKHESEHRDRREIA